MWSVHPASGRFRNLKLCFSISVLTLRDTRHCSKFIIKPPACVLSAVKLDQSFSICLDCGLKGHDLSNQAMKGRGKNEEKHALYVVAKWKFQMAEQTGAFLDHLFISGGRKGCSTFFCQLFQRMTKWLS